MEEKILVLPSAIWIGLALPLLHGVVAEEGVEDGEEEQHEDEQLLDPPRVAAAGELSGLHFRLCFSRVSACAGLGLDMLT